MIVELLLQLISLLWLIEPLAAAPPLLAAAPSLAKPRCPDSCGSVSIPYPFGIGNECYHDNWYEITCDKSFNPPKPFLHKFNLEVLSISLKDHEVTVNSPIDSICENRNWLSTDFKGSPFQFSYRNKFTVMGCSNARLSNQSEVLATCTSTCRNITTQVCDGINCCQTSIPAGLDIYSVNATTEAGCMYAFLVENNWRPGNVSTPSVGMKLDVRLVVGWAMKNLAKDVPVGSFLDYTCSSKEFNWMQTYTCSCQNAYEGNAYFHDGCKVAKACARCKPENCVKDQRGKYKCNSRKKPVKAAILGASIGGGAASLLLLGSYWLYNTIMDNIKLKDKFFKRNGGNLLLDQEMSLSDDQGPIEKTNIFTSEEMKKVTDNFNDNRNLNQGGQGTVYKGMLTDGRIIAIKKSRKVDETQLKQFVEEVAILSQINHRNVVKLLGCCLETEFPLLIYEFVSNGTLFQLLHDPSGEFPLSWELRLQIATEVAGALSYLHSATHIPIYHTDIKSTNILLDDKYRAKVSDFGISIPIDQTHLTTLVQDTVDYSDSEYFQSSQFIEKSQFTENFQSSQSTEESQFTENFQSSQSTEKSQFTEKSDVYSFGIVLVELLTGHKPISSTTSPEEKSLATHFILSLKEARLFDILDARVKKEGGKEEIMAVANLAKRCLNLNVKERPTMEEVTVELERIRKSFMPFAAQRNFQKGESSRKIKVPPSKPSGGASASTIKSWCLDNTGCFSSDI